MRIFSRTREWSGGGVQLGKTKRLAIVASTDEHFVTARISRLAKIPFMPVLHLDVIAQRQNAADQSAACPGSLSSGFPQFTGYGIP